MIDHSFACSVIKIILQFCKENGLLESMKAIEQECKVSLNIVENVDTFLADIHAGRWDSVLPQIAALKLPRRKLEDLYEQVVLELIELREIDAARAVLKETPVLISLQDDDPERYSRLEKLCGKTFIHPQDLYQGTTRERRRSLIAQSLGAEVASVPPSRLMVLIGQALKWQQQQGLIAPGTAFDLFRGSVATVRDVEDAPVAEKDKTIRFSSKCHAECAVFTPDGLSLITGSVDGFIEVWDPRTGRLRKDLQYQADEQLMMHETAVLAIASSSDGELIASGSHDGMIKVWRLKSGLCIRKFDGAHSQGVTSVAFSRDGSHVLSSSYDGLVRIHGIKSGKILKEFRGHASFVNHAAYLPDGLRIASASSDGTVRLWNLKSCECTSIFKPPQQDVSSDVAVLSVLSNPQMPEELIVCTRSRTVFLMSQQGQVLRGFSAEDRDIDVGHAFVACVTSPKGEYLYCLGENGGLLCFLLAEGRICGRMKVVEKGSIGMIHHPYQNCIATFAQDGTLTTWKAD